MPAYVILLKYTQQGLANIKGSPERIKQVSAGAQKLGGRVIGTWVTMGQYDLVGIAEFPDDQAAAAMALIIAGQGNATTQTLKAFSEEEFAQIVSKLP